MGQYIMLCGMVRYVLLLDCCINYESLFIFGFSFIILCGMFWQDVAVKIFSKQEYSEEVILTFRQEVYPSPATTSVQLITSGYAVNPGATE